MYKKNILFLCLLSIFIYSDLYAKKLLIVTLESPPLEYLKNGHPSGRNVKIVTEAIQKMGHECTIQFFPWKRALAMVERGTADAIIDAAYNEERAKYLIYPEEVLYDEKWYAFKLKGYDLSLDENLKNAKSIRLGISRGFEYGGIIQEAIDKKKFKSMEVVHNNELNISKLLNHRFDMFLGVEITISFLAKQMGCQDKIEIVKKAGTSQNFLLSSSETYLAFSKKTVTQKMVNEFSKILSDMKKDGTIENIEKQYY